MFMDVCYSVFYSFSYCGFCNLLYLSIADDLECCYPVDDLQTQCALMENNLIVLENLCAASKMEKAKLAEHQKVFAYEARRSTSLANYTGIANAGRGAV